MNGTRQTLQLAIDAVTFVPMTREDRDSAMVMLHVAAITDDAALDMINQRCDYYTLADGRCVIWSDEQDTEDWQATYSVWCD